MYKMVIRTDDMGYSEVHDMGSFVTYDHGWSAHAEVMLDCPNAVNTLKKLRDMPWVSVGWHLHFWNTPLIGAENAPTLVNPETGRFLPMDQLIHSDDVDYDEALKELRAELEMCLEALGRVPDVGGIGISDEHPSPFTRAMLEVTREYGMPCDFGHRMHVQPDGSFINDPVAPRWEDAKLYIIDQRGIVAQDVMRETFKELENEYDAVQFLLEDRMRLHDLPDGACIMHGFHPAYVDWYIARSGDPGPNKIYYTLSRIWDMEGLCSKRLHDWIKENDIMLCNLRDVLYGTQDFQNHLRHIGSDLCML